METPTKQLAVPTRALASILFACFSFWLMLAELGGSSGGLQNALESAKLDWVRDNVARQEHLLHVYLAIGYRGLAVAALTWCIWSWRTEGGLLVGVAVLFTGLAVAASLLSFL